MANEKKEEAAAAEVKTEEPGILSKETTDEIDGAVNAVVEQVEKDRAERVAKENAGKPASEAKKDLPPPEDQDGDDGKGEKPPDGKDKGEKAGEVEPEAVPDALIERAVKAGMSISDAKSFQKADALERFCAMLEKRDGGDADKKKDEGKEADDPLAAIPDLDPEKYDEAVVAGFKGMKDIIRKQQEVINGLHGDGKSRDAAWFDSKVAALGEAFVEAVGNGDRSKLDPNGPQAKKLAELESKVKVLSAGYKADGKDVSRETVFNEAVAIVLGDVQAKAEAALKSGELEKRKRQHIARPSGAGMKPTTNVYDDVAAKLDQKYFGKK